MKLDRRTIWIGVAAAILILFLWPETESDEPTRALVNGEYTQSSETSRSSSAVGSTGGAHLVRYTEPSLQAFTVEVPADWQVQSGVARQGETELPFLRLRSADGRAEIRSSDPRLPASHMDPSPMLAQLGHREGANVNGVVVRSYVPAASFAENYAKRFAGEHQCAGIEILRRLDTGTVMAEMSADERRRYEESTAEAYRDMMSVAPGAQIDMRPEGVEFRCTGGSALAGKVVVLGTRFQIPDHFGGPPTMGWGAQPLAYIAPVDSQEMVKAVMERVGATFEQTPQWKARQQQRLAQSQQQMQQSIARTNQIIRQGQADRARINSQTNEYISNLQREGYENRMRSQDEGMRRWSNAMMGTTDVYDTQTGTTHYGVQSGYDSYWIDPANNNVIGTPQYQANPDPMRYNPTQNLDDLYSGGY